MSTATFGLPSLVITPYDFSDKTRLVSDYVAYALDQTQSMFEYEGLPETIPADILELYLQSHGHVCFYKHEDKLYVFTGSMGGQPDVYFIPTDYVVANPAIPLNKTLKIDKDCVVVRNDRMQMGLIPMFTKYATQIADNDITMRLSDINARIISWITAPDETTKAAAEKYISDIEAGKIGVIAENIFFGGIRVQPNATSGSTNKMTDLIEYHQYIKACWLNDIGLQANYNMKREAINSNEAQLNEDMLIPFVENMLKSREIGIEKVNAMFGTNISVKLSSIWTQHQVDNSGQPEETEDSDIAESEDENAEVENPEESEEKPNVGNDS